MHQLRPLAFAAALALVVGCDQEPTSPDASDVGSVASSPALAVSAVSRAGLLDRLQPASSPEEALDMINERLAAAGKSIAVTKMEYVTGGPEADRAGQEVLATDRQLHLDSKWVPGDTRRDAQGNLITQISSLPFATANSGTPEQIDGIPPIDASFETWNNVTCSNLDILTLPPTGLFPSAVFVGGDDPFIADIVTIGFLPGAIFQQVFGPGAENILGVTFTSVFIDGPGGPPTDINNDGRLDTALKEVWYNDAFVWSTDGTPGTTDIETVALHENGHALELGHFGRVAVGDQNGKLHVSPRAVMNAFILGTLRSPLGTDNAAYCSNYDSWPS